MFGNTRLIRQYQIAIYKGMKGHHCSTVRDTTVCITQFFLDIVNIFVCISQYEISLGGVYRMADVICFPRTSDSQNYLLSHSTASFTYCGASNTSPDISI